MAPRNPGIVQSDAPALLADLIRELQLIGPGVGLLGFSDQIAPVFIIGARGVTFEAQEPVFRPAEVFSDAGAGVVAGTDIIDTGQLEAGDFDVICGVSFGLSAAGTQILALAQRNAGNTADVASWPLGLPQTTNTALPPYTPLKFSIKVLENERFVIDAGTTDATLRFHLWLMVRRRADVT